MKNNLKQILLFNSSQKIMIILGILGLFPFFFGLVELYFNRNELIFNINIPKYYGAIILTFIGSKYWGIILTIGDQNKISDRLKNQIIIWSIIPSTLGIISLSLQTSLSFFVLVLGFISCQIIDELLYKPLNFAHWYICLRRLLTFLVTTILIFSFIIIS
ncbi:MAG: DUF3429 domain-containing protein [Candidatus Puniceispirillales bacterium]|jgi:hypothetical protein